MHVWVAGTVQGVWFRESTRKEAERNQVRGWVRNLPDGRVEALFEGEPDAVDVVVDWCRTGPDGAIVERMEAKPEPAATDAAERFTEFRVMR